MHTQGHLAGSGDRRHLHPQDPQFAASGGVPGLDPQGQGVAGLIVEAQVTAIRGRVTPEVRMGAVEGHLDLVVGQGSAGVVDGQGLPVARLRGCGGGPRIVQGALDGRGRTRDPVVERDRRIEVCAGGADRDRGGRRQVEGIVGDGRGAVGGAHVRAVLGGLVKGHRRTDRQQGGIALPVLAQPLRQDHTGIVEAAGQRALAHVVQRVAAGQVIPADAGVQPLQASIVAVHAAEVRVRVAPAAGHAALGRGTTTPERGAVYPLPGARTGRRHFAPAEPSRGDHAGFHEALFGGVVDHDQVPTGRHRLALAAGVRPRARVRAKQVALLSEHVQGAAGAARRHRGRQIVDRHDRVHGRKRWVLAIGGVVLEQGDVRHHGRRRVLHRDPHGGVAARSEAENRVRNAVVHTAARQGHVAVVARKPGGAGPARVELPHVGVDDQVVDCVVVVEVDARHALDAGEPTDREGVHARLAHEPVVVDRTQGRGVGLLVTVGQCSRFLRGVPADEDVLPAIVLGLAAVAVVVAHAERQPCIAGHAGRGVVVGPVEAIGREIERAELRAGAVEAHAHAVAVTQGSQWTGGRGVVHVVVGAHGGAQDAHTGHAGLVEAEHGGAARGTRDAPVGCLDRHRGGAQVPEHHRAFQATVAAAAAARVLQLAAGDRPQGGTARIASVPQLPLAGLGIGTRGEVIPEQHHAVEVALGR